MTLLATLKCTLRTFSTVASGELWGVFLQEINSAQEYNYNQVEVELFRLHMGERNCI